jgi:hypothetical protein
LAGELRDATEQIGATAAAMSSSGDASGLRMSVEAALALILEEHQDWNLLVRPHHLPLA